MLLLIQLIAAPALASFEFRKPAWDSTSDFLQLVRDRLGRQRVVLDAQLDWEQVTERDAVLLLHPQVPIDVAEASAFLAAGGRLAIVDDFGKGDHLLARFHIRRALPPTPPKESFRDNPHLAIARPVETPAAGGGRLKHPMVSKVEGVTTNHPSALMIDPGVELTPVLTLGHANGNDELFAAIGVIGDGQSCGLNDGVPKNPTARCGRLFAMADPSVFIDLMMQFEDNRRFAEGLVDYLVENDSWGPRQGKLYLLVNDFHETGHFGGENDWLREVESAFQGLEEWFADTRREGLSEEWKWVLALLAALGTAIWAFRSSGKLYQRPAPHYARAVPLIAQAGTAGRAAVLSAPTTHGALVVVELKAAAEEFLRSRLTLSHSASTAAILETIEQQGALDPSSTRRLKEVFRQMERAEKAIVTSENLRVRAESIKEMHRELAEILPQVSALTRSPA